MAASLALAASTLQGAERSFVYSEVVIPGAIAANAQGINAGGDIVGTYVDAGGVQHGYLWQNGQITTLDYPGAEGTGAAGIGPGGAIVGTYWMPGETGVAAHGYKRTRDGVFTAVHYPGHLNEILARILPDGTILGCRHDTDTMDTMRGIAIGKHGDEEIDVFASMNNGATPDMALIVGLYWNVEANRQEGYVIEDGVFTPFVVPGSNLTTAWDVNPRGEIVGVWRDGANKFHGFLREGDVYVSIDYLGAKNTRAFGINAGGDVVGSYGIAGISHAFVARRTRGPAR
jgi:probable HAF family extracellular repeat protein